LAAIVLPLRCHYPLKQMKSQSAVTLVTDRKGVHSVVSAWLLIRKWV